jgi:uncharacterized phage infection (PIP) family protein YhgE
MSNNTDKLNYMAQEMSDARMRIEQEAAHLKTNLTNIKSRLAMALEQLEQHGTEANLSVLGSLHDQGSTIDAQVTRLNQQRIYLEQAIGTLKLIKLT